MSSFYYDYSLLDRPRSDYLHNLSPLDIKFEKFKRLSYIMIRKYQRSKSFGSQYDRFASYSERISKCSNNLVFYKDYSNKYKLLSSRFCRVRYCPICQWRKSLAWRYRFLENEENLNNYLKSFGDITPPFLFLTLTLRNANGYDELNWTINTLQRGFRKLIGLGIRAKGIYSPLGWIKCLEVTRGKKDPKSYNAHIHLLLLLPPGYSPSSPDYVTQQALCEEWKGICKIDYTPSVWVELTRFSRMKLSKGSYDDGDDDDCPKKSSAKALFEVSKYMVKSDDFRKAPASWFLPLTLASYKRRFVETGGCLRDIYRLEEGNENLINFEDVTYDDNGEPYKYSKKTDNPNIFKFRFNDLVSAYVLD